METTAEITVTDVESRKEIGYWFTESTGYAVLSELRKGEDVVLKYSLATHKIAGKKYPVIIADRSKISFVELLGR